MKDSEKLVKLGKKRVKFCKVILYQWEYTGVLIKNQIISLVKIVSAKKLFL